MSRFLTWTLLILFVSILIPAFAWGELRPEAPVHERPPIYLGQGEQRLLRIRGLQRFSLGSPSVRGKRLAFQRGKRSSSEELLLLKGAQPGTADLWVWKSDGSTEHRVIFVKKVSITLVHGPLRQSLSRLEEAEVIFSGGAVFLKGMIHSFAEAERIAALREADPKKIVDQTQVSSLLLRQAQARLEAWLAQVAKNRNLSLEQLGNELWIRGSIESEPERTSLIRQARSIFALVKTDIEGFTSAARTVYFRVFLLELKKREFGSLGISWPAAVEGALQVAPSALTHLTKGLKLDLAIQALEGQGHARILSNPELVVRAPGEAELFAGGELPIRIQTRRRNDVQWKPYGLTLKLKVTESSGTRVRLDISTEVSHLDIDAGLDAIPGVQANRLKTQVDARFDVPLFLSGLLQRSDREQAKGLPLLGRIPVLGKLFASEDYLNERSELVAILLPHRNPPAPPVERFEGLIPRGHAPPPRNWISPEQEEALLQAEDYPWNVL